VRERAAAGQHVQSFEQLAQLVENSAVAVDMEETPRNRREVTEASVLLKPITVKQVGPSVIAVVEAHPPRRRQWGAPFAVGLITSRELHRSSWAHVLYLGMRGVMLGLNSKDPLDWGPTNGFFCHV